MNLEAVKDVLAEADLMDGAKDAGENMVLICCPFAHWEHTKGTDNNPSMGVWAGEPSNYHCFSCKNTGDLWVLLKTLSGLLQEPELSTLGDEVYSEEEGDIGKKMERAITSYSKFYEGSKSKDLVAMRKFFECLPQDFPPEALEYMESRGLNPLLAIEEFDLRWDAMRQMVCMPIISPDGFHGIQGRSIVGKEFHNYWNSEPSEFLGCSDYEKLLRAKVLVVVEGFYDILRTHQNLLSMNGYEVVGVFKSLLSKNQLFLLELLGKPLIILFDNDEAGNKGYMSAVERLSSHLPWINRPLLPEGKDAADLNEVFLAKLIHRRVSKIDIEKLY